MKILLILAYIAAGSAFIPCLIAIIKFRTQTKALKILSAFVIFTATVEIVNTILVNSNINSLPLHHFYTPIEFIVILSITFIIVFKKFKSNLVPILGCSTIILITIVDFALWEPLTSVNSIPRAIEGISVLALCLFFYYKIFTSEDFVDLMKYPFFWLYSGWLIYFSGTFFLFIYSYKTGMTLSYPIIHSVLYIFLNLVYTYVLWLGSRKSIS